MACKCKENAAKVGKYSDDKKPGLVRVGLLEGITVIPLHILTLILSLGVIIVILPFLTLRFFINLVMGKSTTINLNKILGYNAKRK